MTSKVLQVVTFASLSISLATSIHVWLKFRNVPRDSSAVYTQVETRTVDGKRPFLSTFTVVRELNFSGDQIAEGFNNSIRGPSYLSSEGDQFSVVYSPHLQNLKPGTKVKGWFMRLDIVANNLPEGKIGFVVPVELISADYRDQN
jgi:hypothetical protein